MISLTPPPAHITTKNTTLYYQCRFFVFVFFVLLFFFFCFHFSHDSYPGSHQLLKMHSHVLSPGRDWERRQLKQSRKRQSGKGAKSCRSRTVRETGLFEKPALFQSKELPHTVWIAEFGNWGERKIISCGRHCGQQGRDADVQCDSGCSGPTAPPTGRTGEMLAAFLLYFVFFSRETRLGGSRLQSQHSRSKCRRIASSLVLI